MQLNIFDKIQEIIEIKNYQEMEKYKWSNYISIWNLRQKAFNEIKLLYNNLGNDFFRLASEVILSDSCECYYHNLQITNLNSLKNNRELLSDYFLDPNINIYEAIEFIIESIATNNISKEFIDSIRLHPDSPLFSEKFIKSYSKQTDDSKWFDNELSIDDYQKKADLIVTEIIEKELTMPFYNVPTLYHNFISIIPDFRKDILFATLFKILLFYIYTNCDQIRLYEKDIIDEYPEFEFSKECHLIFMINDVCDFTFDTDAIKKRNVSLQNNIDEYMQNNTFDDFTKVLLEKCKKRYEPKL